MTNPLTNDSQTEYTGRHEAPAGRSGASAGSENYTGRHEAPPKSDLYAGRHEAPIPSGEYTGRHEAPPRPGQSGRLPAVPAARPVQAHDQAPAPAPKPQLSVPAAKPAPAPAPKADPAPAAKPAPEKPRRSNRKLLVGALIGAFVLIVLAAILLRGAAERRSYETYYTQAVTSYQAGDYDGALSSLRRAAAVSETEECQLLMADCYEAQGSYEKALELLRRLDLKDADIQQRIARLESKREQLSRADKVTVNGQEYEKNTPALTLKDQGLTDESLTELSQLYALTNLNLAGNELKTITPLASLGGLTVLDLSRNQISDLSALSQLSGLRSLYLDENPIQDFSPLYSLSSLTTLSIRGISLTTDQLAELSRALPSCAIHSDDAVQSVPEITLGGVTFQADVTELNLSALGISDISALSACKSLRRLDLSGNLIVDLSPLMDIPVLETLNIRDNMVTDLRPLMSLTGLKTINAENNSISSVVSLSALSELRELRLSGNPISDCSGLIKLRSLETLGLENAKLTDESLQQLQGMPSLRLLLIKGNLDISGEAVDALQKTLSSCYIEHDPLVYSVELGGQMIRRNVTELDLSNTPVKDLSNLTLLNDLTGLKLRGCGLENIYSLQWVTGLTELDLACNEIQDATAIASLTKLRTLDISSNHLKSITPFINLVNLERLDLSGNDIPADEIERLRSTLPGCTVIAD